MSWKHASNALGRVVNVLYWWKGSSANLMLMTEYEKHRLFIQTEKQINHPDNMKPTPKQTPTNCEGKVDFQTKFIYQDHIIFQYSLLGAICTSRATNKFIRLFWEWLCVEAELPNSDPASQYCHRAASPVSSWHSHISYRIIKGQHSYCFRTGSSKGITWIPKAAASLPFFLPVSQTPELTKQLFFPPIAKSMESPPCLAQKHHCQRKEREKRRPVEKGGERPTIVKEEAVQLRREDLEQSKAGAKWKTNSHEKRHCCSFILCAT